MSRVLAWRHQGGGSAGHVFVWPTNGAAAAPPAALTTLYRPWLLYGRMGGAHGQLFAWHAEGAAGAAPVTAGGDYLPTWRPRRR